MKPLRLLVLAAIALAATVLVPGGASSAPSCFGQAPTIVDGPGSNRIQGSQGPDVIFAGAGNDVVAAGGGVDRVCGDDGDDIMDAGTANDFMDGGDGGDELHGYNGDDRVEGGPGGDFLDGRRGRDDVLIGGSGRDEFVGGSVQRGGAGNDTLDSFGYRRENATDLLDGGGGNDRLFGDSQPGPGERLEGGPGDDDLDGGAGDDNLKGNDGDDNLDGGAGTDRCRQGPDSGPLSNCE